jgi:hypothetical protein
LRASGALPSLVLDCIAHRTLAHPRSLITVRAVRLPVPGSPLRARFPSLSLTATRSLACPAWPLHFVAFTSSPCSGSPKMPPTTQFPSRASTFDSECCPLNCNQVAAVVSAFFVASKVAPVEPAVSAGAGEFVARRSTLCHRMHRPPLAVSRATPPASGIRASRVRPRFLSFLPTLSAPSVRASRVRPPVAVS